VTSAPVDRARAHRVAGDAGGPDGLSRFDELRRAAGVRVAFLYAFDLLEHDGEDLRERPLLPRRRALAALLRRSQDGIVFNEHIAEEGAVVFAHAASSVRKVSCRSGLTRHTDRDRIRHGSRCAILRALPCSGSGAKIGIRENAVQAHCARANDTRSGEQRIWNQLAAVISSHVPKKVASILVAGGLGGSRPVLFGRGSTASPYQRSAGSKHYIFV
jgi:hypothetical protein